MYLRGGQVRSAGKLAWLGVLCAPLLSCTATLTVCGLGLFGVGWFIFLFDWFLLFGFFFLKLVFSLLFSCLPEGIRICVPLH